MHLLLSVVIRNITKCGIIYRNELPRVPEEILKSIPRKDVYLIELAFKVTPCILVSTDNELIASTKSLESQIKVTPYHRDDFISKIIH
ncbi:MAG: hypothetical protein ACP5RS_05120 [Thermoplasmata archaeon]